MVWTTLLRTYLPMARQFSINFLLTKELKLKIFDSCGWTLKQWVNVTIYMRLYSIRKGSLNTSKDGDNGTHVSRSQVRSIRVGDRLIPQLCTLPHVFVGFKHSAFKWKVSAATIKSTDYTCSVLKRTETFFKVKDLLQMKMDWGKPLPLPIYFSYPNRYTTNPWLYTTTPNYILPTPNYIPPTPNYILPLPINTTPQPSTSSVHMWMWNRHVNANLVCSRKRWANLCKGLL